MIRFRHDLFAVMLFACVFLGRPGRLSAQAPESFETPAAITNAESSEKAVLKAVLETRDEVRALRHEVDSLRKVLESPSGKSGSNGPPPERVERFGRDAMTRDGAGPAHVRHADGVYFFEAPWCGPCKSVRPIVERLKREGLPIVDVNVDERMDLRRDFGIERLPTFVLLVGFQEKERIAGVLPEDRLRALVAKVPKDPGAAATSKIDSLGHARELTGGKSGSNGRSEQFARGKRFERKVFVQDSGEPSRPSLSDGVYFFNEPERGPCEQMRPIVDRLQRERLPIFAVNVVIGPGLKGGFGIDTLPTFVLFVRSREQERLTGAQTEQALRALLAKVPKDQVVSENSNAPQREVWNAKEMGNVKPELNPVGETFDQIIVEGNATIPTAAILEKFKTQPGHNATRAQVQEGLRALDRTRWFSALKPTYHHNKKGLFVELIVTERPRVRSVQYLGAAEIKPENLAEVTGLKVGGPYDTRVNEEADRRLKAFYHEKGFTEATVELISGFKPEERDVVFRIHEGVTQKVVWRYFAGNTAVSGERLARELKSAPAYASILGKFDPANLAQDVVAVRKYYEKLGLFDAKITPTIESSKDHKWLYVRYTVEEGRHYRIRHLSLTGNTRFKTDELLGAMKTHEGEFYNAFTITQDVATVKKKYDQTNYLSVSVEVVQQRSPERPGEIDLVLRVNEGTLYEARAYPVADLVVPLPGREKIDVRDNFEKLIGLVTDTIEPKTWQKAGGAGSITHYDKTLSLIIRQTPKVHRHIAALLRSLRSLQDWQVCLELARIDDPPAELLQSITTPGSSEGNTAPLPLSREQCDRLLEAARRTSSMASAQLTSDSNFLLQKVTMFYGTHASMGWTPKENEALDLDVVDSTDRYAINLRFGLHDTKTGKATAEPVALNVANLKTVVFRFKRIGASASARPSLLIVRPQLLFPIEEGEVR
jgi:thioredoxin-like negative regulator of GroEL